jgi:hypothetical protein
MLQPALRVKTRNGQSRIRFVPGGNPHAPRDVPANRATVVATNVLEENMLMIDRSRNQRSFRSFRLRSADAAIGRPPKRQPLSTTPPTDATAYPDSAPTVGCAWTTMPGRPEFPANALHNEVSG